MTLLLHWMRCYSQYFDQLSIRLKSDVDHHPREHDRVSLKECMIHPIILYSNRRVYRFPFVFVHYLLLNVESSHEDYRSHLWLLSFPTKIPIVIAALILANENRTFFND